jgi:hypothetical protein
MEGMIAFSGGEIDTDTLYHENMHQWWGDNISEGGYRMTFYKEGLATLAEFFYHARLAENAAGGPSTAKGRAAFQASLVKQFNQIYGSKDGFWTTAPSNPIPYSLFDTSNTYDRPGAAYIALRQILGPARFDAALQQLQRTYGGLSISEPELEAACAQQRLPAAAEPVLQPVVRHRLRIGRRGEPAQDHRSWPGWPGLLQRAREVRLGRGSSLQPREATREQFASAVW